MAQAAFDAAAPARAPRPEAPVRILAAEDDVFAMAFLEAQIGALGHAMLQAGDGEAALALLARDPAAVDVVIMDREMPRLDGLSAVRRMKADPRLRKIPVIMVTGADSAEEMKEGLDVGVFYYLTKPVAPQMLTSVLSAAVREARQSRTLSAELAKHRASFDLIETARFRLRTLDEAESLAPFIAHSFPDPERALPGLGELMVNAIEHGIARIGYDAKTELVERGAWRAEVERRLALPATAALSVVVTLARKDGGLYALVEDPGPGFDWKSYLHIDPARAGDNHGRGIAKARAASFDRLVYNEAGNRAIAFVRSARPLDW